MGERGLGASRWAPSSYESTYRNKRNHYQHKVDWVCPSCDFPNVQWRLECHQCARPRDSPNLVQQSPLTPNPLRSDLFYAGPLPIYPTSSSTQPPVPFLGHYNAEPIRRASTPPGRWVSTPRPNIHAEQVNNTRAFDHGLSASRWAPRNRESDSDSEVWTRYTSRTLGPTTNSNYTSNTAPISSDLGLPYQVQHYILQLIQRICEEGCFDFASRWIPQALQEQGWDCAEAIEPKTWKEFLPSATPPDSIFVSKYTLESALLNVVYIRNAAAHRHLCNNAEIQKMTLQARDLMAMFSDTGRQEKFQHLSIRLTAWNNRSKEDPGAARAELETALREISEQPVDDMDWTPNSVSLQELPAPPEVVHGHIGHRRGDSGEAMDLDIE